MNESQIKWKKEKLNKKDLFIPLGWSGTTIVNGFIEKDYNTALDWQEWISKYEQMRKSDAQIFATLLACELPIRSTKWYVDWQDEEMKEFVEKALFKNMNIWWDDFLREVLTMLPFWYSIFEKVYKVDEEGNVRIKKLASRKQSTLLKWQTQNGNAGITQVLPTYLEEEWSINDWLSQISIPADKLVVFTFRQEGDNYEWTPILRSVYKHWYIKDKLYKFDAIKHERQSVWIPVIYLPKGASDEDKRIAKSIVANIRTTEQTWVVMPGPKDSGWLLEFIDTKGQQWSDLYESIKHHNREISKNILAQFLELWDTESGSRALSEDQSSLFILWLNAIANQIAEVVNKYVIKELVDLNFNNVEEYPVLRYQKLWEIDYEKISNTLSTLAAANIITVDKDLEDHVRELFDLPEFNWERIENKDSEEGLIKKSKEVVKDDVKQNKVQEDDEVKKEVKKIKEDQEEFSEKIKENQEVLKKEVENWIKWMFNDLEWKIFEELSKISKDKDQKTDEIKSKIQSIVSGLQTQLTSNLNANFSCNHKEIGDSGDDKFFDASYFNELSGYIDSNFIKKLHQ